MIIQIQYIDKKGFMNLQLLEFVNQEECKKLIKKRCPNASVCWNGKHQVSVSEQYIKKK